MKNNWTPANLLVEHLQLPWSDALPRITEWSAELQPAWLVTQSFSELHFCPLSHSVLKRLQNTFSGRIFNPEVEIRWQLDKDGAYLWRFTETADFDAGNNVLASEYSDQRYYLWGEWASPNSDGGSFFSEGRMVKPVTYPIKGAKKTRAYINVREYRRIKPQTFEEDLDILNAQLNPPRLVAHRFLNLEADSNA